jgi:phage/plasmid-associated DNA primase
MFPWLKDKLLTVEDERGRKQATHFYAPTKSYFRLTPEEQSDFWINYCDTVVNEQNPQLYEVIDQHNTIQLGFDIKLSFERQRISYRLDDVDNLVESIDQYVQHVIGVIQSMLPRYFQPTDSGSEYISCYLRRNEENVLVWNQNTVNYVGRFIFPYARINREYMGRFHHYILHELQLNGDNPNEHLSHPPINGLDTFIQPFQDHKELYYSTPNENTPPLYLYEIYGYLNTDTKTTYDLSQVFVPTLHNAVQQGLIDQEILSEKVEENGLEYWLPLFFSCGFFDFPLTIHEGALLAQVEAPKVTMNVIKEDNENLGKLERARQLLAYMSIERVDNYWSWIDIGQAIYSVDSGEEGLQLWAWITTQSDYKTSEDCDMQWHTFDSGDNVNIETLDYFAQHDNPDQYNAFREKEIQEAIDKALEIQENIPVAKAFKACFPHQFICANYQQGIWYYYNQHRWTQVDGKSMLKWYLSERFQPKLDRLQADIADKKANANRHDTKFKNQSQQRITAIVQLIQKLSKDHFLNGVCEAAKLYYHKPNFFQLKDANPHFAATPSGVIDIRGGQNSVRPGKPQDYISRCTRYAYPHNYHWGHKAVDMTMDYLRKVFRSRLLLEYFIRFSASLLLSGNTNKIFPIFSGQGNNSKSILVRLFEASFGSYACKLPTSLITEKRTAADSATPTLIHAQGAKVAFLEEPNKKEVIQSGTVKHLTGRDTQYVRDLFQKGSHIIEMDVTITPILIANKIPPIPDCQEAIWNRTRVIEFLSRWTSNAPEDLDEQFKQGIFQMDRFFDNQIPLMAPAFLWIIVQKYPEYFEEGLNDPPDVLQATENFRVMNNFYIHFTRDCITTVINETGDMDMTAQVGLDELFNSFKQWWKNQEFPGKVPTKTEFKGELETTWKTKADAENKWYGLRLNEQKNTIESLLSF